MRCRRCLPVWICDLRDARAQRGAFVENTHGGASRGGLRYYRLFVAFNFGPANVCTPEADAVEARSASGLSRKFRGAFFPPRPVHGKDTALSVIGEVRSANGLRRGRKHGEHFETKIMRNKKQAIFPRVSDVFEFKRTQLYVDERARRILLLILQFW